MSARRKARRAVRAGSAPGGVPSVLLADAVDDPLWDDPAAVWDWCEDHDVTLPDGMAVTDYSRAARALREDVAAAWARKHLPSERFPNVPDWEKLAESGIGPLTGARIRRRFLLGAEHQQ